ncbi:MAG TPA: phytanoyl-CoA dioxygenase family protein [Caulobacteraceae bacterium]|jgi:ectoine hydroxylase-related dioxygenase (phytanoyl-CoA dioxygenase family)
MSRPQNPIRDVTQAERDAYARDGAVVLRGMLQADWIERMREAVDRAVAAPSSAASEYTEEGAGGRYLGDFFVWRRDPVFRAFELESPLPRVAAQMMDDADEVTLFYDQLLVKEPMTREETPWHQDLPYWPVRGNDILSLWVGFDPVPAEAGAMRYVKGSHKAGVLYAPKAFGKNTGFAEVFERAGLPPFPDMDEVLKQAELLVCEVEPGDIVVHHPLTFHWSPGNLRKDLRRRALAVRYLGPDAVFDARPGTFLENRKLDAVLAEPITARDGERLGGANFPTVQVN